MVFLSGSVPTSDLDSDGVPCPYEALQLLISLDVYSGGFLSWSVYPVASLLLVWVFFLLAFLFGRRNSAFIIIIGYISTGLYLYLIEQATKTLWFTDLALPILTLVFVLSIFVYILSRFKFFKGTALTGLIFAAVSFFCIGCEIIINRFVYGHSNLFWSLIVAGVCLPVSIFLFFVQSNEEFRGYLQKKFHL